MKKRMITLLLCTVTLSVVAQTQSQDGASVESFEKTAKMAVDERAKMQEMTQFDKDTMLIEETVRQFQEEHFCTAEMHAANAYEYRQYDALLNTYYTRLMAALPADQKAALREAQRSWLTFRDSQKNAYLVIVGMRQGTMYPVVEGLFCTALVRHRVEELHRLLAFVENE